MTVDVPHDGKLNHPETKDNDHARPGEKTPRPGMASVSIGVRTGAIKKTVRRIFLFLVACAVLNAGWDGLAQPPIPKDRIPRDIPGDVGELIQLLYSPNPWHRWDGASQLGDKEEQAAPAVPFLIGMLGDNTIVGASTLGKGAAEALVKIGEPAVEAVVGVFRDADMPGGVRMTAASILGRIKDPRAVEPLIVGLADRDAGVRTAAAGALGEIRNARAVGPLVAALKDHPSPDAMFGALEKIGAPSVEVLIGVFGDKGVAADLRGKAASTLGRLKDRRALEPLISGLSDGDAGVRTAAAVALGELRDARAVDPLAATLKDHPSSVAIDALASIGDPRGADPIVPLARAQDPQVRLVALFALIRLKDPRAAEFAAAELKSQDANVRKRVLDTLASASYPGAVGYLLGALTDPDPGVRRAVAPLISVLRGKINTPPGAMAAESLGKIGDPRAVEPLIVTLGSADSNMSRNSWRALKSITGQDFGYDLPKWRAWWEQSKERLLPIRQ